MSPQPPHFIIEEGPETGRELVIPPDGARIGRALENDITLSDPAMSRFQCRMYFRDGFLHIMDLGSTNETLVNDRPVSDQALRFGDLVLIGESLLKVINDGLSGADKQEPAPVEPEPAPIVFNPDGGEGAPDEPAPAPIPEPKPSKPGSVEEVDLGFGRRGEETPSDSRPRHASHLPLLLVALITMLVVFGVGAVILLQTQPPAPPASAPREESLRIRYEKVKSGDGNIFRYALSLSPDGTLSAQVHDLAHQRSIERKETIDAETIDRFREQLTAARDTFSRLQDSYEGTETDLHETYRMTLVFGRDAKTVEVRNRIEPDAFRQVREEVEAFANTELGLTHIQIPPAELRERAATSWKNAKQLYAEKEVKNDNLWRAVRKLKDVLFLLDAIEPKPDYYREAVELEQVWSRELNRKVEDLDFEAVRAYRVGNIARAIELYRRMLATYPEKDSATYKQAFNNLVRLEQELNR